MTIYLFFAGKGYCVFIQQSYVNNKSNIILYFFVYEESF